ncbi:MAG: isoprenyl transferase, partial [Deltaproteobacteria bacterium]|nr:isoprenyl transferase [Deltaproteobacteria bacterium]
MSEYKELLKGLDKRNLPRHIAIIMDGNGRWAKKRDLNRVKGHEQGSKVVKRIVETAARLGVRVLSLYAFSKENWNRPHEEVDALMHLLHKYLLSESDNLIKNGIRIVVIGDLSSLAPPLRALISDVCLRSRSNTGMTVVIALSYGGRYEIVEAIKAVVKDVQGRKLDADTITEETFGRYLFTKDIPDPDLLIRTSGEKRISNFMLWQIAYTELYITKTLWPDFTKEEFLSSIIDFQKRQRRFGMTDEQIASKKRQAGAR